MFVYDIKGAGPFVNLKSRITAKFLIHEMYAPRKLE